MNRFRWFALLVLLVVAAACGDPNASDTPGAGLATNDPAASQPSPSPTPAPLVSAAAVTTPCTKGETKRTVDGVEIRDTKCGSGPEATRGSSIEVKYVGKLASGKVFDSTAKHGGKPFSTPIGVGAVIPGWDEGVPGMRVGGVRILIIPPALAYGASGVESIPPNSTLEFTITLVSVKPGPSPS